MDKNTVQTKKLIDDFCRRTGLTNGERKERYLWTDAVAVQTMLALSRFLQDSTYAETAQTLIKQVHQTLGTFHPDDSRHGYISKLSEREAKKHPTISGLRIGKELPERTSKEVFDEHLEWKRDGQYFHYLSRWIVALLNAAHEDNGSEYFRWASELIDATEKFIYQAGNSYGMYWKMNTDLSQPLVNSMGAQDPLEGLICTLSLQQMNPEEARHFDPLKEKFIALCRGKSWITSDPLGIGGLLLNTLRSFQFSRTSTIPDSVQPENLLKESLLSLDRFRDSYQPDLPATMRLAFRECGLTLGIQTMIAINKKQDFLQIAPSTIQNYQNLANEIESFWMDPDHQKATTWNEHLNINAVSLAASLIASKEPLYFL